MQQIINKIIELKQQKNAIILAHTYQLPEIQNIADFVGDSFGLSKQSLNSNADIIVFCGVHFMAETAKILAPNKMVLLPEISAGCPMADMIDETKLTKLKQQYPNASVVTYINSSAKVKALSDVICTSSNALKIVKNIPNNQIIFAPDKCLGSFVAKNNPDKQTILMDGYCNVHVKILPDNILNLKKIHPSAIVLAHPECLPEVLDVSDFALSTSQMIDFAKNSKNTEFIIATEIGIMHILENENPAKKFYHASKYTVCPNMKKTNLEKLLWALEDLKYEINVDENIAKKAKLAIDNMFKYSLM